MYSPEVEAKLAEIRVHANVNYEKSGWDIVVECYTNEDIYKVLEEKKFSVKGTIRALLKTVRAQRSYEKEVASTAF